MSVILAIETSGAACSSALLDGGTCHARYELTPRGHAERILGMVDAVLTDAGTTITDVHAVAFGCGPGSFTGVRIAAGVAQGLAYGARCPAVAVSSLRAAAEAGPGDRVLVAFDARMGEVYYGAFERGDEGVMRPVLGECVSPPATVPLPPGGGWVGIGEGFAAYPDVLAERLRAHVAEVIAGQPPRAEHVARIAAIALRRGETCEPWQALPVYLRNRVVRGGR